MKKAGEHMSASKVQINELHLRVPGINRTQAGSLGEMVAKHLSTPSIGGTAPRNIPALSVRVGAQPTNAMEPLAARIADAIRRKV